MVEYHVRLRELPDGDRPRERLRASGPDALSNSELLAILLRTGTPAENVLELSNRLLAKHGGLEGIARIGFDELAAEHGLGEAKVAQVKAALQLGLRMATVQPSIRPIIRSPDDAANLVLHEMGLLEQEELRTLLLNTRNQVMDTHTLYKGSAHSASVRVGEVFKEAIRRNASAIIVVHNHPSGDPTPSSEDVRVTRELVQAGHLLDVEVLDHLVIGHQKWLSLKQAGLAFSGKVRPAD